MSMMHRMAVMAVAAGVALSAFTAAATQYSWTNAEGDGDWRNPGNFVVGGKMTLDGTEPVATVQPGSSDDVFIPKNTTVTLVYDRTDPDKLGSCEAFAALKIVRPTSATSMINITVPADETFTLNCQVTRGANESNVTYGPLVKKGGGELLLTAASYSHGDDTRCDYFCTMKVEEGVVKLPQTNVNKHYRLGNVTIEENGTLFTAHSSAGATAPTASTEFYRLFGNGTITNDCETTCRMRVVKSATFGGRITGNICYYSGGNVHLTGTNSTFNMVFVYQGSNLVNTTGYGTLGVQKFGMKAVDGEGSPSSIGYADDIYVRDYGGALLYLGEGETTDKNLRMWPTTTSYPTYLDAGATGGLVWTGAWGDRPTTSGYTPRMLRLIIQGSNTQECVMSGPIESYLKNGTNYTVCITKKGTGTWSIRHNDSSKMLGVWQVLDGTLKYDTIANASINTALGSSTRLYKDICGVHALDENKVDYAFWLGGGEGGNRANLEYVGATNCTSTTRRFMVDGTGAILNNGGGFLRLSDFVATNTASTLVLGGTNTLDNLADCISDGGDATMSVVKEGSGTWRIGTNCTFTGALDVRGGKLVLGNPEKYTYYRWSIKENFYTNLVDREGASSQTVCFYSMGLYDNVGRDWAKGLSNDGYYTIDGPDKNGNYHYKAIACVRNALYGTFGASANSGVRPGSFRLGTTTDKTSTYNASRGFTNLFNHVAADKYFTDWNRDYQKLIRETNATSWVMFIMRPPENANPITSWDYVNGWSSEANKNQLIRLSTLEASVDGNSWDELQRIERMGWPSSSGRWQSDDSVYSAPFDTHFGMPIPPGPTNDVAFAASSVYVAAGAELVAYAPEKPVIHALTIDGTEGGGRIEGFAFAPGCAVNIVNPRSGTSYEIPMALVDDAGLDGAAEWPVSVGGTPKANLRVSASSTGLLVRSLGAQFIIR